MSAARPPRVFRVTGAVWLFGITAVIAAALLVEATVRSGIGEALLLAPWLLLLLWVIHVAGIASDVRADTTGVGVQNLVRRTWVPWSRMKRVAMRWQLELTLDDGQVVRCFGGPSRSRPRRLGPGRTREDADDGAHDGIAKLQRLRLEADVSPEAVVLRSWDRPAIIAFAVLAVWAVIAIIVTRFS
ncbi:PH domain-containing protein [Microbacterium sp. KRD172]|uniref:PH domain-containing protein n=1 Tax=Microbacterium sp. KRD172 TaxID=2729727 RepID=UPI0019D1193C|nr:PH domain-containing protein [Microbacterium sp. KRD172]